MDKKELLAQNVRSVMNGTVAAAMYIDLQVDRLGNLDEELSDLLRAVQAAHDRVRARCEELLEG
jgi:hypothetical protein